MEYEYEYEYELLYVYIFGAEYFKPNAHVCKQTFDDELHMALCHC